MSNNNYNCGIYKIENIINGKCYIGQSINLISRKSTHFNYLKKNKSVNTWLQNAYNKYGESNFSFNILLYCENFELTKYETFFVDYYRKLNLSYNIRECVNSNKGIVRSTEFCKKISERQKGKLNHRFGKTASTETKKKMSNTRKGIPKSTETKLKMSLNHPDQKGKNNPMYGKHLSKESIEKRNETRKRNIQKSNK